MSAASIQEIPKLDLSDFTHGNQETKLAFVQNLGRAYEEIGFVAISNHGIAKALLEEMYEQVEAFYALPLKTKLKYDDSQGGGQRGYTGFGKEHAKDRNAGDLKEFWHFGQYVDDSDILSDFYPPNKIVDELPRFNTAGKEIYAALELAGAKVLQAIALFLQLDEYYFDAKIHNGNSILRPIHYPAITEEPKDAIRAGEHEDINLITLLVGASADGLEVLNKNNEWIGVTEVEDHIIVNVGDMLERLTNNRLKSTTHRVINPPREKWSSPRFSIPFFLHPRPEVPLNCLDSCCTVNNPKKHEDCTANEFLIQRLTEIGLI